MRQAYHSSIRNARLYSYGRNQIVNHSINQTINQTINRSINRPTNTIQSRPQQYAFSTSSNNQSTSQNPSSQTQSTNQSNDRSNNQSNNASNNTSFKVLKFAMALAFATGSMLFFQTITSSGGKTAVKPSKDQSASHFNHSASQLRDGPPHAVPSFADAIGNTPLVLVPSLSKALGRDIYVKLETMNPGGSIKDRAAKAILEDMQAAWLPDQSLNPSLKQIKPVIVEATGGNTGIALAMLARHYNFDCLFVYPNYISPMKVKIMQALGATTIPAPMVAFSSPQHFYHKSHALADVTPGSYHTEQFENTANWRAHYTTTGPEIFTQTEGKIDGFVCGSGTGGTLGGTSAFLKEKHPSIITALVDPPNSGMYHWLHSGHKDFTSRSSPSDPGVMEGVGTYRLTANFARGNLDRAFAGSEIEAIRMAHHVKYHDGLFVGASSALNLTGAVKLARQLPEGSKVVTIVMDGGQYYTEKLYNREWLTSKGLAHVLEPSDPNDLSFIEDGDQRQIKLPSFQ